MITGFFARESTVAAPGFNRFQVPPAALAVHLCIGQAYAFSTFNLPLTKLLGITQSAPGDWNLKDVGWIFSIAILFLGSSAAIFGRWVERVGPRLSMLMMALAPMFSTVIAWLFLNETLDGQTVLGIVLAVGGVILVVVERQKAGAPTSVASSKPSRIVCWKLPSARRDRVSPL